MSGRNSFSPPISPASFWVSRAAHIEELAKQKPSLLFLKFRELQRLKDIIEQKNFVSYIKTKSEDILNKWINFIQDEDFVEYLEANRETFLNTLSSLDPIEMLTVKGLVKSPVEFKAEGNSFKNSKQYSDDQAFLTLMLLTLVKKISTQSVVDDNLRSVNSLLQSLLGKYINIKKQEKSPAIEKNSFIYRK